MTAPSTSAFGLPSLPMFDVFRWRPLAAERFVAELCAAGITDNGPVPVKTTVEEITDGGTVRIIYWAEVQETAMGSSAHEPYLLVINDPALGKSLTMVRTDVLLSSRADPS